MMRIKTLVWMSLLGTVCFVAFGASSATASLPVPTIGDNNLADRDGDGVPEAWGWDGFDPGCGCACPVTWAGADVQAAGSEVYLVAGTAVVFCGTLVFYDVDPNALDPSQGVSVTPICAVGDFAACIGTLP